MSIRDDINKLYEKSKQLECLEKTLFVGDLIAALVSLVENDTVSKIAISVQITLALLYLVCNIIDDGHFWYIAERERRKNSIQNGLEIRLSEYETEAYYNNNLPASIKKCAMNSMESNFFSKSIAGKMIIKKTCTSVIAVAILLNTCIFVKDANLLLIIAQTIFSTYVLFEYIMLLLYKSRMENLYENAYNNMILGTGNVENVAWMMYYIIEYEAIKAHYKIRLDEKIFLENNASLTDEWNHIINHSN